MTEAAAVRDPLLDESSLPFAAPAFDRITSEDFLPAFRTGIASARAEIDSIAGNAEPPTIDNTIVAMERAGAALARVRRIFWTLSSAQAVPAIRAIEAEVSAMMTEHGTAIAHDARLFARVDQLWEERTSLVLDEAQLRLLTASHRGFIDGGALLDPVRKERFATIQQELAALSTRFGQNVLAAAAEWSMHLSPEDCAGLPDAMLASTAKRAEADGLRGHVVTLSRGDVETFLSFAHRRDLRERIWRSFTDRGAAEPHDNRAVLAAILTLRQKMATLLGERSYADYALKETMAATPEAAEALLKRVWAPALERAAAEQSELQQLADRDGVSIAAWDWRYYAEQVRRDRYALDGAAVKTFLTLEGVRAAAFRVAGRLYGLQFDARKDLPTWHPDARAWAVTGRDGQAVGLLYTDFAARPEKHGGAWMGTLRVQEALDGPVRPIVYIVGNFAMREDGDAGLSIDESRTLFHEFGHALHALLSQVTYPSQAGTAVVRDFVEFPSKFMEHWIVDPSVLVELGVPAPLIDAIGRADEFGQGFATVEFVASAILDLALHRLPDPTDPIDYAEQLLGSLGLPDTIVPRHGLTHFTHIFDGGYASQYYSYLWAEVLDADAFEAFADDPFDQGLADRFAREILEQGDTRDPLASFIAFRGRPPREDALLRSRGLLPA
ncbi:M3 family metallopeptidase [Sphingomonas radiodurans]|uniref:M3 family metallopeptidase n=1 Tax=Sphingomonas radiodurans TaxID=2890321 RepID=UPI001E452990|nr:M3 family metallopeptidase [Sphingomonas radiodurans]WBH15132.1 M3 family metallopeptidase [Sphingomonas radiodurans]